MSVSTTVIAFPPVENRSQFSGRDFVLLQLLTQVRVSAGARPVTQDPKPTAKPVAESSWPIGAIISCGKTEGRVRDLSNLLTKSLSQRKKERKTF